MVIKSLEIENFLTYFGSADENRFQFKEGPTIVIGQNMTGKSKLFDAFKWVLFDKAYNTKEEAWKTSAQYGPDLINDYAKSEAKTGEFISASVCLSFEYRKDSYRLTRIFKVKKTGSRSYQPNTVSDLQLTQVTGRQSNSQPLTGNQAEVRIRKIVPEYLSEYFLLQGESISSLMSLHDKGAFHTAMKDISRIEVFDRFRNISRNVFNQCKREFEKNEGLDSEINKLSVEMAEKNSNIVTEKEKLNTLLNNRAILDVQVNDLKDELKTFEKCKELVEEIDKITEQKKQKEEERRLFVERHKELVLTNWSYAGTQSIFEGFSALYRKYQQEHKIPEPISQFFVEEMLNQETCLVCDRPALKGSPEYKSIYSHKSDKSLGEKVEQIHKVLREVEEMLPKVNEIPEQISEYYNGLSQIEQEIDDLVGNWKVKDQELDGIVEDTQLHNPAASKDELKNQVDHPKKTKTELDSALEELHDFDGRIKESQGRLQILEDNHKTLKNKYDALKEKSENKIEMQRMDIAERVKISSERLYKNFLGQLVKDIEKETNLFFEKMTEGNLGFTGSVRVDYEGKEIYTVNKNGNRMRNINQANKVSLQISFVAAILKVSNRFWNTNFPFIADAPISVLGGDNKLSAVKTMLEMFDQSILIFKDDSQTNNEESKEADLIRGLIKSNGKIKSAYELAMAQTSDPNYQNTKIDVLKR